MRHKVYRSIIDPILFLGVPYQFFIGLGFAVLILIVLTTFVVFPMIFGAVLYLFAVMMTKKDVRWLQIILTASKHHGVDYSKGGTKYVS